MFASLSTLFDSTTSQYLTMLVSAFSSATLLPGNSEVVFAGLIAKIGTSSPKIFILWAIATLANTLGSLTTYFLARFLARPLPPHRYNQWAFAQAERFGSWVLLLSWLPIMGDLLCGIAGWLKLNFLASTLAVFVGKGLRYGAIWLSFSSFELF